MADEYISRKSIERVLSDALIDRRFATGYDYAILTDIISDLPAADVQPVKHGHWEEISEYGGWGDTYYRCSVCGEEWHLEDGTPQLNNMNFCPYCGADMREAENDNGKP